MKTNRRRFLQASAATAAAGVLPAKARPLTDDADLDGIQLARVAQHRQEPAWLAFTTAGARAVVTQIPVGVDAAMAVVPCDLDAFLGDPFDRGRRNFHPRLPGHRKREPNDSAMEKQRAFRRFGTHPKGRSGAV